MTSEQAIVAQGKPLISTQLPVKIKTNAQKRVVLAVLPELTKREIEVLRLVAQGLTNAQVAAQLVISPRTVNTHLTSIYSKIQVFSRAAATRYAIEHQLV